MRMSGTVKWFNDAKGFGFTEPEEGAPTSSPIFQRCRWTVFAPSSRAAASPTSGCKAPRATWRRTSARW